VNYFNVVDSTDVVGLICTAYTPCGALSDWSDASGSGTADDRKCGCDDVNGYNAASPAVGLVCTAYSVCGDNAGYSDDHGTGLADDRKCGCNDGYFNADSPAVALACIVWTDCGSNGHQMTAGSATTDHVCSCDQGYFGTALSMRRRLADADPAMLDDSAIVPGTCQVWTDCGDGSEEVTASLSNTADRVCICTATVAFADGGDVPSIGKVCTAVTPCGDGASVASFDGEGGGTPTRDQYCGCDVGNWNVDQAGPSEWIGLTCANWTDCGDTATADENANVTTDMTCTCLEGYYNDVGHVDHVVGLSCKEWLDCKDISAFMVTNGSTTDDVVCECDSGFWSETQPPLFASACVEWTTCASIDPHLRVKVDGTLTADAVCECNINAGYTYDAVKHDAGTGQCKPVRVCSSTEVQTAAATTVADTVCICATGWTGDSCGQCTSAYFGDRKGNPTKCTLRSTPKCDAHAQLVASSTTADDSCSCNAGYAGNGLTCKEVEKVIVINDAAGMGTSVLATVLAAGIVSLLFLDRT